MKNYLINTESEENCLPQTKSNIYMEKRLGEKSNQ